MLMNEFMTTRKSTRDFKDKALSKKDLTVLEGHVLDVEDLSRVHNVHFALYDNGDEIAEALEGHAGYGGVMIKAPAYIAMSTEDDSPESSIFGAYYLEELVTKAYEMDLGSCWITVKEVSPGLSKALFKKSDYPVRFLLAVGYRPMSFSFGEQTYSSRLGIEEFVYDGEIGHPATVNMLENYGLRDLFHYLRYAPSTKNTQPWRFVVKNDGIYLYMKDYEGDNNYVDIGICMYYYVKLQESSNIVALWELGDFHEEKGLVYIGKVNY